MARIAFDLDGTLIPVAGDGMATEPSSRLARLISAEAIRAGSPELMRSLRARGHEVWLYTTSLRSPFRLRLWLRVMGVRLDGVINQTAHDRAIRGVAAATGCSKYPPLFGIDFLVEDSEGVQLEGQRHGFHVLVVEPRDAEWVDKVLEMVGSRGSRHARAGGHPS